MTITGNEEALRTLRDQFPRSKSNVSIRAAIGDAIDDSMTFGEAEIDLSEVGVADVERLAEEARELVGRFDIRVVGEETNTP